MLKNEIDPDAPRKVPSKPTVTPTVSESFWDKYKTPLIVGSIVVVLAVLGYFFH